MAKKKKLLRPPRLLKLLRPLLLLPLRLTLLPLPLLRLTLLLLLPLLLLPPSNFWRNSKKPVARPAFFICFLQHGLPLPAVIATAFILSSGTFREESFDPRDRLLQHGQWTRVGKTHMPFRHHLAKIQPWRNRHARLFQHLR